jgi:hypothetical protein
MRSGVRRRIRESILPRTLSFAALVGVSLASSCPLRADATVVRVTVRGGQLGFQQDNRVPPSQAFDIEVVSTRAKYSSGALEVWPEAMAPCTLTPPDAQHRKQHHVVSLLPSTDAAVLSTGVLRGTVPPLQLGQTFCFKLHREAALGPDDVTVIAGSLERAIVREAVTPTDSGDLAAPIRKTLATSIQQRFDEPVDVGAALEPAVTAVAQAIEGSPEFRALDEAGKNLRLTQQSLDDSQANEEACVAVAAPVVRQKPLPLPFALLPIGDPPRYVQPEALFDELQNIPLGIDELSSLMTKALPTDRPPFARWIEALSGYLSSLAGTKPSDPPTEAAKAIRKELRPTLPPAGHFLFWDADRRAFLSAAEIADKHVAVNHAALLAQLRAYGAVNGADIAAADEWVAAIAPLQAATKAYQEARQELTARRAAYDAVLTSAAPAFLALVKTAIGQQNIEVSLRDLSEADAVGTQRLGADASTITAVDGGLVLAVPTGGKAATVWLVPTLGLNLYLSPVERTVPLDDLVGCWLAQRFSATVGFTLVTPSLPGRTVTGHLFGQYLLVGGGLRLSQFTRFVGGVILYEVHDPNPGSIATRLYGAPYLGFSADFDVVKLLLGGASALLGK